MCSCDDVDANRCERREFRRARKAHRCCECRRTIEPGTRYHYFCGINFDGVAFAMKWCVACDEKLEAFQKAEGGECWPVIGELLMTIRECMVEDPGFTGRFLAARREIRRQRAAA